MHRADPGSMKTLPDIPIVMARHDLEGISGVPVPPGCRIRAFRPGEEREWARVETAVGEFRDEARALEHFAREFGPHVDEMRERCLFLETADGTVVGTSTAWRNPDFQGGDWGRIHWVAVDPAHQGRGMGRLLVTEALLLMRRWHERAYLTTQTSSWVAVHLYLTLGFTPLLTAAAEEEGWSLLRREVPHPLLGPSPAAGSPGS